MLTKAQVIQMLMHDAGTAFEARLATRLEEGFKTEAEAKNMQDRLHRALQLVATPERLEKRGPGLYRIQSTGKNHERYYDVGKTCSCPDADLEHNGKAHFGWCKHKAAVYLVQTAEASLEALRTRLEGLKLPHAHTWTCGHETAAGEDACWDATCTEHLLTTPCVSCTQEQEMHTLTGEGDTTMPAEGSPKTAPEAPVVPLLPEEFRVLSVPEEIAYRATHQTPHHPEEYEPAPTLTPKLAPLPEAPASLNLKVKHHNVEVMMTLRAHTDAEILERLPQVLEGLSKALGIKFTNE